MSPTVSTYQPMDERINEFKRDPQKMEITTKFVNDVVEKAKNEALKRMNDREKVDETHSFLGTVRKRKRWHSRARTFLTRFMASFCICNTETKV